MASCILAQKVPVEFLLPAPSVVSDSLDRLAYGHGTGNNPTAAARHGARMYDGGIGADLMSDPTVVVTVTKSVDGDNDAVFVDATCPEGGDVTLIEVLGMLEYAKHVLLSGAS